MEKGQTRERANRCVIIHHQIKYNYLTIATFSGIIVLITVCNERTNNMYDEDGRWYPTDGYEAARHGMMNKDWASETTKTIKGLEEEIRMAEIKEDQDYLMSLAKGNL